jgi:hypothetical protein
MPQHPVFTSDLPLSAVIAVIGIALPVYASAADPAQEAATGAVHAGQGFTNR